MEKEKKKIRGFKDGAVSKPMAAENHHCPIPKGCADFQRLSPFRAGQKVDENHNGNSFETAPELLSAFTEQSLLSTNNDNLNQQPNHITIDQKPNQQPNHTTINQKPNQQPNP